MSLGPPFDHSGERLQLVIGAAAVLLVSVAVGVALLASDQTLGEALIVHVRVHSPGPLHTGAQIHLAGQRIGEVVAIRGPLHDPLYPDAPVELLARIQRAYRRSVYRNSQFFANEPTVLLEAALEVGPPPRGAAPDRPVEDGDVVRGADPAEIDELLARVHQGLTTIMALARELDPQWTEFRAAAGGLMHTLGELGPPEQIDRIAAQGRRAYDTGKALLEALEQAQAPERVAALSREFSRAMGELSPQLRYLGQRMDQIQSQLGGLAQTLGPQERQRLVAEMRRFREVLTTGERLIDDVDALNRDVQAGRGTVGGFLQDLTIFDEYKETMWILKNRSWRLLLKGKDRGQRNLR